MPQHHQFKYDVAFSLLGRDYEIAQTLADRLAPLKCFVFTREQRNLVGRSGVEAFAELFRRDARLAVILYRAGYGETEYTDLEARGIQDRAMETRWQTPILLNLDGTPPPEWLPKRNIWLDLQRYPLDQAVGAIRLRSEELGASSRLETAAEFLARATARKADEDARRRFEQTDMAVKELKGEFEQLLADLNADFTKHSSELSPFDPFFIPEPSAVVIATREGSISLALRVAYTNTVDETHIYFKLYDGYVSAGDRRAARTPQLLADVDYSPHLAPGHIWRWVPDDSSDELTTTELGEQVQKRLYELLFEPR